MKDWKEIKTPEGESYLQRTFTFKDFNKAFGFMTQVALLAEKQDHHPTWSNTWNTVEIRLSTHSAGNQITDKDKKLANSIDHILSN